MTKMTRLTWKDRGILVVVDFDIHNNNAPYMFKYDAKNIYVDADGAPRCMKCTTMVNQIWTTEWKGDCHCTKCGTQTPFRYLGYAEGEQK